MGSANSCSLFLVQSAPTTLTYRKALAQLKAFPLKISTQNVFLYPYNAVSFCFRSHLKQYLLLPALK